LGDYLWNDVDKNGLQDNGEPGFGNRTVFLVNAAGTSILEVTKTDVNGYYRFTNLNAGTYTIKFPSIMNMVPTLSNVGSNNAINSKQNGSGLASVTIVLGDDITTVDAGYKSNGSVVLPVKDILLTAVLHTTTVDVNWNTINETNTNYFELQRSFDNNTFTTIAQLNTLVPNGGNASYHIADNNLPPSAQVLMYRIKLVDRDGRVSYSRIATIRINKKDEISVWPNPFVNSLSINYTASKSTEIEVRILDVTGKAIRVVKFSVGKGTNNVSVEGLQNLSAGSYLVEISGMDSKEKMTKRIIK
jgi:hypothetical protein